MGDKPGEEPVAAAMAATIGRRLAIDPGGNHHIQPLFDELGDHRRRARRIVGRVAVDQHVDVGLDVIEHPPHHVTLALIGFAANHGARTARRLRRCRRWNCCHRHKRPPPAAPRGSRRRLWRWRALRCNRAPEPRPRYGVCEPVLRTAFPLADPLLDIPPLRRHVEWHDRASAQVLAGATCRAHHSVSMLARPAGEGSTWQSSSRLKVRGKPSIEPLVELVAADMERVNGHDHLAHRLRGDDDPGGGQPPHQFRRQTAAADADVGAGAARRLWRRRPYQARRRSRIHAHRDAASRRRGRRERIAARPARCTHAVGQRSERAGRRFPARPGIQDDGRGRQPQSAGNSVVGRRGDRRRRGHAARRRQEHGDDGGRIYRGDPRQDRRTVRRRLRGRAGAVGAGEEPSRRPAARSA